MKRIALFLLLILGVMPMSRGELKTEFYTAAVNGSSVTNYRKWTTTRNDAVILVREDRCASDHDDWSRTDQMIMSGKHLVVLYTTTGKNRSAIYYANSPVNMLEADWDNDGACDHILLTDPKDRLIDGFSIGKDVALAPMTDEELDKLKKNLEDFGKAMKNMD